MQILGFILGDFFEAVGLCYFYNGNYNVLENKIDPMLMIVDDDQQVDELMA